MGVTVGTQRVDSKASREMYQSTSVPSGAFSSGLGNFSSGFGKASDTLHRLALQMAEEDNETAAKEADVRIAEGMRSIVVGDPNDPEATPGYLNVRGNVALNTFGDAENALRAVVDQELENTGDIPARRALIEKRAQRRLENALDRMTGHANQQRIEVQDAVSEAREAQALADVSADWQDDAVLRDALGDVKAEVLDRAQANGITDDGIIAAQLMEHQSIIVRGAFSAALVGEDVGRARVIFANNADKVSGPVRTAMAQSLAQDTKINIAQRVADEALATYSQDPARAREYVRNALNGQQRSAAISVLNGMINESRGDSRYALAMRQATRSDRAYKNQIEGEARTRVNHDYTLQQRARAEELKGAKETAYNWLYTDPKPGEGPRTVRAFRSENPKAYDILAGAGAIDNLVVTERNVSEGRTYAVSSDGITEQSILLRNYEELARIDPVIYRSRLTESEYGKVVTTIASARRRVDSDAKDQALYRDAESELKKFYPISKYFDPSKSTNDANTVIAAQQAMSDWITAELNKEDGKRPSPPEIKAEAAKQMMRININTGWLDTTLDFEGFASQRKTLNDGQRKLVVVEKSNIPETVLEAIYKSADESAINRDLLTDDILENLAGALAMDDTQRIASIFVKLGGIIPDDMQEKLSTP